MAYGIGQAFAQSYNAGLQRQAQKQDRAERLAHDALMNQRRLKQQANLEANRMRQNQRQFEENVRLKGEATRALAEYRSEMLADEALKSVRSTYAAISPADAKGFEGSLITGKQLMGQDEQLGGLDPNQTYIDKNVLGIIKAEQGADRRQQLQLERIEAAEAKRNAPMVENRRIAGLFRDANQLGLLETRQGIVPRGPETQGYTAESLFGKKAAEFEDFGAGSSDGTDWELPLGRFAGSTIATLGAHGIAGVLRGTQELGQEVVNLFRPSDDPQPEFVDHPGRPREEQMENVINEGNFYESINQIAKAQAEGQLAIHKNDGSLNAKELEANVRREIFGRIQLAKQHGMEIDDRYLDSDAARLVKNIQTKWNQFNINEDARLPILQDEVANREWSSDALQTQAMEQLRYSKTREARTNKFYAGEDIGLQQ